MTEDADVTGYVNQKFKGVSKEGSNGFPMRLRPHES